MASARHSVSEAHRATSATAQGDLTVTAEVHGRDEVADLLMHIHPMQERLHHVLARMHDAQVHEAIEQLNDVTQSNAALVEEYTAAVKTLDDQVQALRQQINRFKLRHVRT